MPTAKLRFDHFEKLVRVRTREFYELPVQFWNTVLGDELHFHLGHFPRPGITLAEAGRHAVEHLAARIPRQEVARVLDVGCGWGAPAFMLSSRWNAEVLGLTVSERQVRYVNQVAQRAGLPVRTKVADIEQPQVGELGRFDVIWSCESLEHMMDRRGVLARLRQFVRPTGCLALTMTCRTDELSKPLACSTFQGIAPLDTAAEIRGFVEEGGWKLIHFEDCTGLTLPIWDQWVSNLERIQSPDWKDTRDRLTAEFTGLGRMFQSGLLQSIQLIAVPEGDRT